MLRALATALLVILISSHIAAAIDASAEVSVSESTLTITLADKSGNNVAGLEMQIPSGWMVASQGDDRAVLRPASEADSQATITVLSADRFEVKNLLSHGGSKLESLGLTESGGNKACKSTVNDIVTLNGQRVFHGVLECIGKESGTNGAAKGSADDTKGKEKASDNGNQNKNASSEKGGRGNSNANKNNSSKNSNNSQDSDKSNNSANNNVSSPYYSKVDLYVIFGLDKSFAVILSAGSPEAYEKYQPVLESSLDTARVKDAVDLRQSLEIILGSTNVYTKDIDLKAGHNQMSGQQKQLSPLQTREPSDDQVRLTVTSSSKVSSIDFDGDTRRLSISLDEDKRSQGNLLVPIDRVLSGPYQVYVNGEPSDNYTVIGDEADSSKLINVQYGSGTQQIEIIGTGVVPEFDVAILGALIFGIMLSVSLLHRSAGLRRFYPSL